jgi:hypothetical protein
MVAMTMKLSQHNNNGGLQPLIISYPKHVYQHKQQYLLGYKILN